MPELLEQTEHRASKATMVQVVEQERVAYRAFKGLAVQASKGLKGLKGQPEKAA
jgi:hypothetical protein